MLNKLLLNNQILANKKSVKKVKVNLVNKMVQKLRKLNKLTDKYPENDKLKTKLMKANETLVFLKKAKNVEILKQSLLNDTNPYTVITNGRSTPEEVAHAMFFSHKIISEIKKKLKELLHLGESDTTWKEEVNELSKRKKKHIRTEKKQRIRQERKARNELNVKRNKWLVENIPKSADTENIDQDTVQSDRVNLNDVESEHCDDTIKLDLTPPKAKKNKESLPPKRKFSPNPQKVVESDAEDHRAVDPFFITGTGTNYLSTAVVNRFQPDGPNDGLVRKERRAAQMNRGYGAHKRRQPMQKAWEKTKPRTNILQANNVTRLESTPTENFAVKLHKGGKTEKLHPSWAAKQKQKGIQSFQGTKVTFDDDLKPGATGPGKKSDDNAEKLHPSWAAKQKLKPCIAEFKGQKIVFGEV